MVDAYGYGQRIRQIQLDLGSQIGRKVDYVELGVMISRVLKRTPPYKKSAVSEWIAERNEPPLAVFLALGQLAGRHPAWIAFGDIPRGDVWPHVPRDMLMDVMEGMRPAEEVLAEIEAEREKERRRKQPRRA